MQLGTGDAHEAARHVQPCEMIVIFNRPVHGVAGQAIFARQRKDPPVPDPAQPTLGCRPDRALLPKAKIGDAAGAEPIRCSVGSEDPAILEVAHPAVKEAEPEAAP